MLRRMASAASAWLERLRGRFLVFDGPDGSGKSTQMHRLLDLAESARVKTCHVREPGGTLIGEEVRRLLLDPAYDPMDLRCEMLLYMASRAQLVAERIAPALGRGELVLADRFISSTLAYQGTAGGLAMTDIRRVGEIAVGEAWPDLTLIFDVDQATAEARMNPLLRGREFASDKDRIEMKGAAFHRRVRQGYLDQAKLDPQRYVVLDARSEADAVFAEVVATLQRHFGPGADAPR
jgi:dTMP kinase